MNHRSRPCAICTTCKAYSFDKDSVNTVCGKRVRGRGTCDGKIENRDRFSDWLNCTGCDGTGYTNGKRCDSCQSYGWTPRR